MNPSPGPGPGYTVSLSAVNAQQVRDLHREATADGRGAEFASALREVSDRLRDDPVRFGEELFDLRGLRLTVKVGVVLPLVVEFGVYADRRIVFVRSFRYAHRADPRGTVRLGLLRVAERLPGPVSRQVFVDVAEHDCVS